MKKRPHYCRRGVPRPRGSSSANLRGSTRNRRARKEWLIKKFGIPRASDGALTRVPCHHCGRIMRAYGAQWEVDRFPVCGHAGGRYVRENVVIACVKCNRNRCSRPSATCRNLDIDKNS